MAQHFELSNKFRQLERSNQQSQSIFFGSKSF